jgi:hypothetical protein
MAPRHMFPGYLGSIRYHIEVHFLIQERRDVEAGPLTNVSSIHNIGNYPPHGREPIASGLPEVRGVIEPFTGNQNIEQLI